MFGLATGKKIGQRRPYSGVSFNCLRLTLAPDGGSRISVLYTRIKITIINAKVKLVWLIDSHMIDWLIITRNDATGYVHVRLIWLVERT